MPLKEFNKQVGRILPWEEQKTQLEEDLSTKIKSRLTIELTSVLPRIYTDVVRVWYRYIYDMV